MRTLVFTFLSILLLSPTAARAEWWEAETEHFVVKARASEQEAKEYALELAQFDATLRLLQGMDTSETGESRANKVTVYRFGRPNDMARLLDASGSGIAGFFIPQAGASVGFAPTRSRRVDVKSAHRQRSDTDLDPRTVLFHEYTHYFMMQYRPGVYPRWYVEGFAEMMATMRIGEDGAYHIGDPPQHRVYQIFNMREFALRKMLDPEYKLRGSDGLQHYATGWLLTHYLSFNTERLAKLRAYLDALSKGDDSVETAERLLGNFDELEKELDRYKDGPFPGFQIVNPDLALTTVKMRKLSPAEESVIMEEMQLASGADEGKAREIASHVQGSISKFGESAHLLELLADAHYTAHQYDEADAVGEKLLALYPDLSVGWLYRAASHARLIAKDPENAEKARSFATNAAVADRRDPRALIVYYLSYILANEAPSEDAGVALEHAYEFAGTDPGYRLLLARHFIGSDQMDTARTVLLPIAFQGHKVSEPKDENTPTPGRLLKLIEDRNRDAALAMISEMIDDEDDDK